MPAFYEYLLIETLPPERSTEADEFWPPNEVVENRRPVLVHRRGPAGACFDARKGKPDTFRVVARRKR